LYLFI